MDFIKNDDVSSEMKIVKETMVMTLGMSTFFLGLRGV